MSRQNTNQGKASLLRIAAELRKSADAIEKVAMKFEESKIYEEISVGHGMPILRALDSVPKFCAMLNLRIDDMARSRNVMPPASKAEPVRPKRRG